MYATHVGATALMDGRTSERPVRLVLISQLGTTMNPN